MIKKTYNKSKQTYKVAFELPTERVGTERDVRVLGNFNDWSWDNGVVMKASKNTYKATTELPAGHYQFRYLVDGHEWANDGGAEAYTDSGYGSTNCCFALEAITSPAKKAAPKKAVKKAAAKKTTAKPAAKKATAKKATAKPATKKSTTKKATAKKGDDLKKIEGIGPKIAGLLNDAGVTTFSGLAKASPKKLADVLQAAGARFRLAKPTTWQEQAKIAAAGKWDELKKLQDELKGGIRK